MATMRVFFLMTALSGCNAGSDVQDIADCNEAGGCEVEAGGGGGAPVGGGGQGEDDTSQDDTILAKAPNDLNGQPFVGDFYAGKYNPDYLTEFAIVCEGKNECEIPFAIDDTLKRSWKRKVEIDFRCPKHLFVPRVVESGTDGTDVRWDEPGDWGLAPNGRYNKEQNQREVEVATKVQQDQILLVKDGGVIGLINGNSFEWTEADSKYSGTISEDLHTITYHLAITGGNEFDTILTLVE